MNNSFFGNVGYVDIDKHRVGFSVGILNRSL